MGMILRIASSRIVGQGDIVGRSGDFSLNLSANSVMRGRLDARRTLKSLVADLRFTAFEKYPAETEADFEKIITSPEDPRPIGVIPDSRGILRSLHCLRNLGYLKEIVILVSTATPKEYLNYLEERHYPYIVSGNDHVDYEKAFQILHEQYGCKYMRTDSGGGLTNKLLENGLIDEISLVISPCFVGNKEKQLFDNLLLSEKVNLELQGTENAEHGCLSLRYAVKNKD